MRSVVAIFTRANATVGKIAAETRRFYVAAVFIEFGQFVHEKILLCIYKNKNSSASIGTDELFLFASFCLVQIKIRYCTDSVCIVCQA